MKDFIIQPPPAGKTTCSLLAQYYRPGDGRGKKRYLGSVNLSRNPHELPRGLKLRPGVELTERQLEQVRVFLLRHGTFGQLPVLPAEVMDAVRTSVRAEIERDIQSRQPAEPEAAVAALQAAAGFLAQESGRLRDIGVRLSPGMLNSLATEPKARSTEMDNLKVRANRIRRSFQQLEAALKAAGLMKSIRRTSRRKSAA